MEEPNNLARIKVVGVGGAGNNVVDELIKSKLEGVDFIAINTDSQVLGASLAPIKIQIGDAICAGRGTGGNPAIGRQAAMEDKEKIIEALQGADLVWIAAGMGGGTGTGAVPIIAEAAKELNILTVAVITTPFVFEGGKRMTQAIEGIENLKDKVDSYIVVPNEKLLKVSDKGTTLIDAFMMSNEVLKQAVKDVSELILRKGLINRDLTDVKAVLQNKGKAVIGTGIAKGDNRAVQAISNAISYPLLEDVSIEGALSSLIIVFGNESMGLQEISSAVSIVQQKLNPQANVYWGAYIDKSLEDSIKFTVIISGILDGKEIKNSSSSAEISVAKETNENIATKKSEPASYMRGKVATPTSSLQELYDIKLEDDYTIPAYKKKLKDLKNILTPNEKFDKDKDKDKKE
jgi:cell division protein FtsZ